MKVAELAKQIEALSPDEALTLLDSITGLQERATQLREEKARAEREKFERYPSCSCGEPATLFGYFLWYAGVCKPGIGRATPSGELRGGLIMGESESESPPEQKDTQRIEKTMWVKCDACEEWWAIENGFDLKVGNSW